MSAAVEVVSEPSEAIATAELAGEPSAVSENTEPAEAATAAMPLLPPSMTDESSSRQTKAEFFAPRFELYNISQLCSEGKLAGSNCGTAWGAVIGESMQELAGDHIGNWTMDHWMRYDTFNKPYWAGYRNALRHWRWSRWNDDDPFLDDYVGHAMQGAIAGDIYLQNSRRAMSLPFENTKRYWASRGRALLYAAAFELQWKLGPASEASLEKVGSFKYYDRMFHKVTNGSGMVDLVYTELGGTAWIVAEDMMDRYVVSHLEQRSHNPLWLLATAMLTPCHAAANLARARAPWYRDNRRVKAFEPTQH